MIHTTIRLYYRKAFYVSGQSDFLLVQFGLKNTLEAVFSG